MFEVVCFLNEMDELMLMSCYMGSFVVVLERRVVGDANFVFVVLDV